MKFRVLVFILLALLSSCAFALDTTQCGALKCESLKAALNPGCGAWPLRACGACSADNPTPPPPCPNGISFANPGLAWKFAYGSTGGPSNPNCGTQTTAGAASCNCTQADPVPGGSQFARGDGKICQAGCLMKPVGPTVCYEPDPQGHPGQKACTGDGWVNDSGINCDPLNAPVQPTDPVPDPAPCKAVDGHDLCIHVDNHPPKYCGVIDGNYVCVPDIPSPCAGNQADGHTCAGDPAPAPPPPPATQPDPNNPNQPEPPPLSSTGGGNCTAAGSCSPWTINVYPPGGSTGGGGGDPGDPGDGGNNGDNGDGGQGGSLCPDGTHPVNGQCSAQHGTCPDGSQPVNGQCAGTVTHCADGSLPVNGSCSGNGNCANGQPPVNGTCGVTCPDGSTPNNGQCTAPWQPCQNGSQPVNGQCPAGTCNPQTDPNHCEQGHASGGGECGAAPACNGDQIGCAVLFQTWSTRCEVAKLNPQHLPEDADYGPTHTASEVWAADDGDPIVLNDSGWLGGGGGCPELASAEFMGMTVDLTSLFPCDALKVLATIILLAGYAQAAFILGRGA